jgi:hypothetical protein
MHSAAPEQNTGKSVDVTIYLTSETLGKIFQDRVNQMLDKAVSGSVNTLPAQSRASVLQMANAILQPSASLTGIIPQQDALNTSLRLYLYPGDPHPIDAQMQIMFRAISLSTMQVSVKPLPGSPSLASGPVASIRVPLGQLTTMGTTPACGMTALAIHLQFPLSLSSTSSAASQTATPTVPSQQTQIQKPQDQNSAVNVSVGIL